ncbi:hypothetical protein FZEAL_6603 [Fusarium zealandicum]|uniref:Uncharacterized protein n=1 Tax=Fusarium zealandicum TaxID=1053134 RepID=A0A8H4UI03_9HYPO|nr:hypothetical protein FZEAL_6603 [Fusarium zealandicum]
MLRDRKPTRVAVFLPTKSPLYSIPNNEVVATSCSTLAVDPIESRAKLMTIWKWDRLTIFAFDIWYDRYDWATAHHQVDLPVLHIDYGKRYSSVKVGGQKIRDEVNRFVAKQHECHGWDAKPPYFQDQTGPKVPTYMNPRCRTYAKENGTIERMVKTPPPGSSSAYPSAT